MSGGSVLTRTLSWEEPPLGSKRAAEAEFALPTGTVTLMLADIEGSVRLWESRGEEMPDAIARLDRLISEIVRRHEGVLPREQGEGDSLVAAFSRPSDALACALALQLACAGEEAGVPLALRIALHTGEVQLRDEGNYIGHAVNRCARIRDTGHGRQTLLSQATADLVIDQLPKDVTLRELGTYRLRDLARAERIYQICHPGLADDFPPLRSLDALPNNLPVELTSFVGRDQEMAEVLTLLDAARMLTLTGSGGCGKTRLALQVAARRLEEFPDGVWLVDLSSADASRVPRALAEVLRVREQPGGKLVETLVAHLAHKRVLLVLDNCEHVVAASADLADALLKGCPALTLMATSREPLGLPGETTWLVPSLSLPKESEPTRIEALTAYDAVRLFIERATKSRQTFLVTNENAPAVAQICHRLDGIPLAIELAAARVRLMTPEQIAKGLDDRFHLLTGSPRVSVPRQQTLQASVDWSYDLLTAEERALFQRLAVFVGGFTLGAAEQVCAYDDVDSYHVLDLVARLVDKSLVVTEDEGTESRYTLLQTIRQYALDRLAATSEETALRQRHFEHFAAAARSARVALESKDDLDYRRVYRDEHGNFVAALEWAISSGDGTRAMTLSADLLPMWWGVLDVEGHQMVRAALELRSGTPIDVQARALCAQAYLGFRTIQVDPALPVTAGNEAAALAKQAGDLRTAGRALWITGFATYWVDAAAGEAMMEESVALVRETGDDWGLWQALGTLGSVRANQGRVGEARSLITESLDMAQALGTTRFTGLSWRWLAYLDQMQGHLERAVTEYEKAIALFEADRTYDWAMGCLLELARAHAQRADHEAATAAARRMREGLERLRPEQRIRFEWGVTQAEAMVALFRGDTDAARVSVEESKRLWAPPGAISWNEVILRLVDGDTASVKALVAGALDEGRPGWESFWPAALWFRASAERGDGELDQAENSAHEGLALCIDRDMKASPAGVVACLELLAGIALDLESYEEATRLLAAADASRSSMEGPRPAYVQAAFDEDCSSAREAVGQERFAELWAEGAAMSIDEAIEYAQRGRGERKRPSSGWASLTPTELEVAKLVAEGLRNAQIAQRLFVTRHTVETHLKHIFSKLGLSSRTELALQAARRAGS